MNCPLPPWIVPCGPIGTLKNAPRGTHQFVPVTALGPTSQCCYFFTLTTDAAYAALVCGKPISSTSFDAAEFGVYAE